ELTVDERELELRFPVEVPQDCAPPALRYTPWTDALLTAGGDTPVYPATGLARGAGPTRVLVGDDVVEVAANAAGPRLPDGRILRVGRDEVGLTAAPVEG